DPLYAEMKSAILVIECAHKKGWNSIWLKCNSSLVVDIFNGKSKVPWKLQARWTICKIHLSSMNFKVSHIYREGNACADSLAKFGISSNTYTWWNSIPTFIHSHFYRNWLGLPNYRFLNL
ncbi:PREDICTED: uncharacterized protein LOC109337520, partial [Lupinus angustifolius]|uniref:uncharacterized protein LOC109337520 n=1 Tax=Lupinus angustifolius TaxID=3871 RepID=UPI00092E2AC1